MEQEGKAEPDKPFRLSDNKGKMNHIIYSAGYEKSSQSILGETCLVLGEKDIDRRMILFVTNWDFGWFLLAKTL
jgi:hypothetical protein